jgi:hypothetical protein
MEIALEIDAFKDLVRKQEMALLRMICKKHRLDFIELKKKIF